VAQMRRAVPLQDGIRRLGGEGVTQWLELGPEGVLTALARECVDEEGALFAAALRAGRSEVETFAGFLGRAHAAGAAVDWRAFYAGSGARPVELPTYAFQRQRYWVTPGTGASDPGATGLDRLEHPLLAAAVQLGDRDEEGRREIAIYSRSGAEREPARHARGMLAPEAERVTAWPAEWPPEGAEPLPVDELYARLGDLGYDYGPVFQGLRAAWRD